MAGCLQVQRVVRDVEESPEGFMAAIQQQWGQTKKVRRSFSVYCDERNMLLKQKYVGQCALPFMEPNEICVHGVYYRSYVWDVLRPQARVDCAVYPVFCMKELLYAKGGEPRLKQSESDVTLLRRLMRMVHLGMMKRLERLEAARTARKEGSVTQCTGKRKMNG